MCSLWKRSLLFYIFLFVFSIYTKADEKSQNSNCITHSLHIPETVTSRPRKLIIAHRGASYHLPEHTIEAYRLALELGADFVEPDLVATSDGVLIAMHSTDLNVTTDVATVFADREPWFSPTANRSGYWSFNFTAAEIAKLKVKQRLPAARSTQYDGLFGIPTLKEILDTLNQWNTHDLPLVMNTFNNTKSDGSHPSNLQLGQSGVYAELKDAEWLKNETGMDLVDLFFRDLQAYQDSWKTVMPCFKQLLYNEYKVPGLVIQSFDAEVLRKFSTKWDDTYGKNNAEEDIFPKPPLVLLTNKQNCWGEDFWFQVGDDWRDFISGIGTEKTCLLGTEGEVFVQKANEFELALHPWTERPELEYVAAGFDDVYGEIQNLLCGAGAGGIFTEAVHVAILAAKIGCDDDKGTSNVPGTTQAPTNTEQRNPDSLCYTSEDESNIYVGLAAFIMGCFLTTVTLFWLGNRSRRRRYAIGSRAIPTQEEEDELEMT